MPRQSSFNLNKFRVFKFDIVKNVRAYLSQRTANIAFKILRFIVPIFWSAFTFVSRVIFYKPRNATAKSIYCY